MTVFSKNGVPNYIDIFDINDYYNFDAKPWGRERSYHTEILTRSYGRYGSIIGARVFRIYHRSYKLK